MSPVESALDAAAISAAVADREVRVLEETTSTNDLAFQLATADRPAWPVVFAERQNAGRGQHGKHWDSAAGKGLWFSIALRDALTPEEATGLTNRTASIIAETIQREFSLRATVKPPNDVYLAGRKLAGVLLELRAVPHAPHLGVLGIGVNVNHDLADFPEGLQKRAGSIAHALGRTVDRQRFAIALLRALYDSAL